MATAGGRLAVNDLPPATLSVPSAEPSAAAAHSAELTYYETLRHVPESPTWLRDSQAAVEAETAVPEPARDQFAAEELPPPLADPAETKGLAPAAPSVESTPVDALAGAPRPEPRVGRYHVQVVELQSFEAVERVVDQLKTGGLQVFFVPPDADAPRQVYKVQVGPFDDIAVAERVKERLEAEYQYAPYILR